MNVSSLLKFIPEKELEFLAAETNVDFQVKKLKGISMFRLLLFSMLQSNKVSLRVMESFYNSAVFKTFAETGTNKTKYNSISDRIATVNPEYFEKIFHQLFDKFSNLLNEGDSLIRFDSTMVAISSKLVTWGMKVGSKTTKKQIKYTIGLKGSLPCHVSVYDTQSALCEDITIPPAILSYKPNEESIVVFDRGVQKRKVFIDFTENNIRFVTRVKTDISFKIISKNVIETKPKDATITVKEDYIINVKESTHGNWSTVPFRLTKAIINKTKEKIYFFSNIMDLTAYEIGYIYKQRWDIEVFFKFVKQELNLNHLVSRSNNGIKVMIYMTFILSILIIAYKKLNKLKGFKIPRLNFARELESAIIKDIVIICGGKPGRMPHLFSDS